jgi:two-component system heavy metal sensor histidine kinase CusS
VSRAARGASLAGRLVLLFALGSVVIMSAAGYALYHALRMQLESQDLAEIAGKTEVVEYVLRDIDGPAALEANLSRLRDISIGHPHLAISVRSAGRWLLPPPEELASVVTAVAQSPADGPHVETHAGDRIWWLRRVHRDWPAGAVDVVVAVETTETRVLLRDHAAIAAIVALLGSAASALLALFVVRRGLAPLAQVEARAGEVTAQRLGARMDLGDAPREVHGLADAINRMLERLEESFRTLEQFSADIAHELRTPLNNLLLQTQVTLGRTRSAEEYQEALHLNLVELERLQRMISEMLFLARAERGMIELAVDDIDVGAEARSVAEYFEAAAAERSQQVAIAGEARLRGDRMLLRRALTNLLSNAVRYSPDGARIEVEIRGEPKEVRITVANPGPALAPAELERLFSRFARRDESRGRAVEGAGLGLAIVDTIMKAQGGSVEGRSEGGRIAFTLRLPRRG